MITSEEILNMNFYKKDKFTGSYKGMRYLLKKDKNEEEQDIFRCYVWAGPYNFETTAEEKIMHTFPFTEDGKAAAADWMNEQWKNKKEWPHL